jgi:tetratricopeptide (TPR) repeat protein
VTDPPARPSSRPRLPRAHLPIALLIALATFAAYAQVFRFGFVNYDDGQYVYENPHLPLGLTGENLRWIFLSFDPDNWFPVTRLSLLLDYRLFALRAGWYHAENVVIHVLASLLLFGFLRRATGVRWPCAFVALAFALHPLHVESVAWVAERKDVLCAFFWFAALWAWVRFVERPTPLRYGAVLALFGLGLMSKPMIVTLPFLLFLLDWWPLNRGFSRKRTVEKIPLLAISVAVMVITVVAQHSAGAVKPVELYPMGLRLQNAAVTLAIYIRDTVWPASLWIAHPFPESLPPWQVVASALAILAASLLTLRCRRTRPWLVTGWFWFLVTLIPVIGLVQVGTQSRADRYMYVPMVGLLIMAAWSAAEIRNRKARIALAALASAACAALGALTWVQTGYWATTEALFRHALDRDSGDYQAWVGLAQERENDPATAAEAVSYYQRALRLNPRSVETHNLLGMQLVRLGRYDEAIAVHRDSLRLYPAYSYGHYNLGSALLKSGRRFDAMKEFEAALRLNPDLAFAHNELGVEIWRNGRIAEGIAHLKEAVRIKPDFALAQYNLGKMLMNQPGHLDDAILHFQEALKLNPLYLAAHSDLGIALTRVPGQTEQALVHLETAEEISPDPERRKLIERLERERGSVPQ